MFKAVLLLLLQVFLFQSIAGQFVGSRLAAAPLAFAEDVYEGFVSIASALPYLGTEILVEALPNNDVDDISGFAGPFRTGGNGRYGDGPVYRSGVFGQPSRRRYNNYDSSYAEAYAFAGSLDIDGY